MATAIGFHTRACSQRERGKRRKCIRFLTLNIERVIQNSGPSQHLSLIFSHHLFPIIRSILHCKSVFAMHNAFACRGRASADAFSFLLCLPEEGRKSEKRGMRFPIPSPPCSPHSGCRATRRPHIPCPSVSPPLIPILVLASVCLVMRSHCCSFF